MLPGAGKAGGIAATQAAKQAVNRTLAQALKTPITTLASKAAANPVKTAVLVEGTAGTLQNVAAQKAEMAADLREDYNASETLLAFGLSGAPVGALGVLAKGKAVEAVEAGTDDIVKEATEAVAKANAAAKEEAKKTLKKNRVLADKISGALRPLDPELVQGQRRYLTFADEKDLSPDFTIALDPTGQNVSLLQPLRCLPKIKMVCWTENVSQKVLLVLFAAWMKQTPTLVLVS